MTDQLDPDYLEGQIRDRIVAGRLGEVDEAAAAVVFLASDSASYISGVNLPVQGRATDPTEPNHQSSLEDGRGSRSI